MIDKGTVVASALLGAAKLVSFLAQSADVSGAIPGVGAVANLSAVGAIIYIVVFGMPRMVKEFREERVQMLTAFREENQLTRADRDKERERVVCKFEHPDARG